MDSIIRNQRAARRSFAGILIVPATALFILSAAVLSGKCAGGSRDAARPDRVKQEGQPVADLGNGRFRNPILAGNFPDPSVVRVGKDYYMTHSSNDSTPGLLIWHSRDLVNWELVGYALREFIGDVWAPDFVFYKGLYYAYFPARVTAPDGKSRQTCFVITARTPAGPWSAPIDLDISGIDPGHAVDASGNRYLYVDGGRMIRLTPEGLRTEGTLQKVYDGWPYPADWNVECMCLESPKVVSRQGFYYLVSAQGGTAGPSTSHMIVIARSKSPAGPWENSPLNPLLRTASRNERWWSQGHGTLIEAADGTWWVMYHGFENDFRTLGRQTLLMPVEWTADGWPRIPAGRKPSDDLPKPAGDAVGPGMPLSDDFRGPGLGPQWRHWDGPGAAGRYVAAGGELRMAARGSSVADAALLTLMPANHSYEVEVEISVPATAEGGLLLYYDAAHFGGAALKKGRVFSYLRSRPNDRVDRPEGHAFLRLRNIRHDVSAFFSRDGKTWTKFETGFDTSGYHREILDGWGSLRVALFAAGEGTVVLKNFRYRGWDGNER
jgi:xylan 1,4-beta-xylosidase